MRKAAVILFILYCGSFFLPACRNQQQSSPATTAEEEEVITPLPPEDSRVLRADSLAYLWETGSITSDKTITKPYRDSLFEGTITGYFSQGKWQVLATSLSHPDSSVQIREWYLFGEQGNVLCYQQKAKFKHCEGSELNPACHQEVRLYFAGKKPFSSRMRVIMGLGDSFGRTPFTDNPQAEWYAQNVPVNLVKYQAMLAANSSK
ncbi:MAG: hypothetical protein H6555_09035 [Lewinellaceae bacterium]|nr:hypothetical protein [Lewinellaceae bacterium]